MIDIKTLNQFKDIIEKFINSLGIALDTNSYFFESDNSMDFQLEYKVLSISLNLQGRLMELIKKRS